MARYRSVLLILLALAANALGAAVEVNKAPPAVEHRKFERNNPPSDMPPLEPQEAAVTKSVFGIASEFSVQAMPEEKRGNKTLTRVKVTGVTLNLSLKITVWLPTDAPRTIVDHEEGHRQISEYFYKDADKIARVIAQKYMGRTYEAEGGDAEGASRAALDKAINELSQIYMAQTQNIAARANEIFDEITSHGRNQNISVDKSIKLSIERAKKEKEKK